MIAQRWYHRQHSVRVVDKKGAHILFDMKNVAPSATKVVYRYRKKKISRTLIVSCDRLRLRTEGVD